MPASISLELRGLKEAQAKQIQVMTDLHGPPLVQAVRDSALIVTRTARQESSVDTGRLRASITPEVRVMGETVEGVVGSNVVYAPYAILGTRPHFPPISALTAWARRHGVEAHLVARAIARRGTKGDQSLIKGIEQNAPAIYRKIEAAVGKVVDR